MKNLLLASLAIFILSFTLGANDAKTYSPDDEGFIRNWLVLDPIAIGEKGNEHSEESQKEFFDKVWVPRDAKPKAGDKATIDGKALNWKAHEASDYFIDFEKVASDAGKEPTQALYLAVVYITAPEDISGLKLKIGSDDSSLWHLNGKEIIRVFEGRAVDKDQNDAEVSLKKGLNVLTMAVINGEGPTGAAARFTKGDQPVKNLKITLAPPAP